MSKKKAFELFDEIRKLNELIKQVEWQTTRKQRQKIDYYEKQLDRLSSSGRFKNKVEKSSTRLKKIQSKVK